MSKAIVHAAMIRASEIVSRRRGLHGTKRYTTASAAAAAEGLEARRLFAAPVFFSAQPTVAVGPDPESAVVADFNRDGRQDLAVSNLAGNSISVTLGNGDGTFQPQQTFATGAGPDGLASADLNRDGIPDLIATDDSDDDVAVLLGVGDGTFHSRVTFAAGAGPQAIAVADLNGDGKLDAAVANSVGNNVSILLGNGNGGFSSPANIAAPTQTSSIALADVNGDGKLDVVDVGLSQTVAGVNLGDGNGNFGTLTTTTIPGHGSSVAIADFNGDGKPDAVVAEFTENSIAVLLGDGTAQFQSPVTYALGSNTLPPAVRVGDTNGDGVPDVIVSTATSRAAIFTGNSDGSLNAPQQFNTGLGPAALAVADVNGDGSLDVVTPNLAASDVSVLLNVPPPALISLNRTTPSSAATQSNRLVFTANFSEPVTGVTAGNFALANTGTISGATVSVSPASGPALSYTITVANIAGSGTVSLNFDKNASTIMNVDGETLKAFAGFNPQTAVGPFVSGIAVGDMNGDGIPDSIIADRGDGKVAVLLGSRNGSLASEHDVNLGGSSTPVAVAVADLNGDGKLDVVAAEEIPGKVAVMLGNGDGTLGGPVELDCGVNATPEDVTIADMNQDGRPDIVVANFGTNNVGVFLGIGPGTFNTEQTFAAGVGPNSVAVADADGDGFPDVVVANANDQTIGVLPSNARGTNVTLLGLQQVIPAGGNVGKALIGDVNGDGKLDLVTFNNSAGIEVFAGDGSGHFAAEISSFVDMSGDSIVLADINGDGIPDVVGSSSHGQLTAALGNGDGTFQDGQIFDRNNNRLIDRVAVADFNRDGLPDLIVNDTNLSTVGVELNAPVGLFASETYSVLKRDVTVTATGAEVTFDGNVHPATFTALSANGEDASSLVTLSYQDASNGATGTTPPSAVGIYQILASLTGSNTFNAIGQFDTGRKIIISPLSVFQPKASGKLPTAVLVAGQKMKPIRLNIKVLNSSDAALTQGLTVRIALSTQPGGTDADFSPGKVSRMLTIKAHQTASFGSANIGSIPSNLSGKVFVLLKLTDATGAERVVSIGSLNTAAPNTDLAAISVTPPAKAKRTKRFVTTIGVLNRGNVLFSHTAPVEYFLSGSGSIQDATDLGPGSGRLSLQPNKKGTLRLNVTIPSTVAAGSYFFIAKLDPANTLGDSDQINNIITSGRKTAVS